MIKVKSFTAYNADEMENKINVWLKKGKDIEIIEVSQSQNSEGDLVILIFYRDKGKKNS